MQVPKLEENQQTLQHLQQERLLYFDVFRKHMRSYCIKSYLDRFGSFLKGRNPLLWWKHPRAHILKVKSLKKKEIEEKEMTLSLKIVYSHPISLFLSFLILFFDLEMF